MLTIRKNHVHPVLSNNLQSTDNNSTSKDNRYGNVVELRYGWQVDPISFGNDEDDGNMIESGSDNDGPPVELRISQ